MEVSLWQTLLDKTCSFHCLSQDNFDSEALQKNYAWIVEILRLLKPIVDSIVKTNITSHHLLNNLLEQLVFSIDERKCLFQNWNPLASRIYLVLQAELLAIKIRTYILEIVRVLRVSYQWLPQELSPEMVQNCSLKVENMRCESTSTIILEAMKVQVGSQGPERLVEIAHYLGLNSNLEILIEAAALEKLKKSAEEAENYTEMDKVEQLITLVTCMHDCLLILTNSQSDIPIPIPADFICPLSLVLMRNPVIVSSGKTYERSYIRKWFDLGLTVCPKTRQSLGSTNLIPNYTSKALIANWCEINDVKLHDPIQTINEQVDLNPCSPPALVEHDGKVKRLVEDLSSNSTESLKEATDQLRLISKQNMYNRTRIAYHGGIRSLVDLIPCIDAKIQENAVTTLLHLAINNDNKIAIANADGIEPLICVLQTGTPVAQENSAATLFCLSMIQENKFRIGRMGGISPLVKLLEIGTPLGKNNAIIALFNLAITHENRGRIVNAGGVKHLVELMKDPVAGFVDKVVALLECLSRTSEGRQAIAEAGGLSILVEVVELGSARAKENAAAALLQLCTYNSRYCRIALQEGAVPPLATLSLSGTPRAKEKAQCLINHFRSQRHPYAGRGSTW